jgi:hypothetical protein
MRLITPKILNIPNISIPQRYAEIALAESTWLRSWNFWIFPVDVFGMVPNTTAFGVLNPDMCGRAEVNGFSR